MAILSLRGDSEQLGVYFGFWVAIVLIPTLTVWMAGQFFGDSVKRLSRLWRLVSIGWALLVVVLSVLARGPFNPFDRYAMPLAVAVTLLIVVLPPMLFHAGVLAMDRIRRKEDPR